jgi:hypothetical protein
MSKFLGFELILALAFALPAFSQQRWERNYGGTANDLGRSVHQTFDGGYIIAGWTYSFGAGGADVYLIKTDASGDTAWARTYGGPLFEDGYYVAQTSDSGYIIVGSTTSYGAGSNDVYLIKTDASGDTVWTRTYGGSNVDQGNSVLQTSDGYVIAGWSMSYGAGGSDVYLIRTDASGDTLWTKTFGGSSHDYSHSIAQTRDGGYVLAGWTNSFGAGNYDVFLIKTDASGDTVWTRTYGGTSEDYGIFVAPTADSGCVIAGLTSSFGAGGYDIYLIKTDTRGDTVWTKTYGSPSADWGYCVAQTSDGGYAVAADRSNQADAWLLKTNAAGDTIWTKTYGGPAQECADAVALTSDGGYILAGLTTSYGAGGQDVYIIKTDAYGNAAVEKESKGFEGSRVNGIKVNPNPFTSFASIPGHEVERFSLYDISGRKVGTYKGDRVGEGLAPGVYFLRSSDNQDKPLRIVKVR